MDEDVSPRTKKLINDPDAVIEEMLEGMLAAHPSHLARADHPRAIVRPDAPTDGKVGLVIGGGSGHEPTFVGFVGRGLADGCAVGNVFASPPPDPALECVRAVSGGAGVLFMYGNYAGDVMNFDMAAEFANADGIEVRTVLTTDDVASAPPDKREERRGVAGNTFIFKAAGAAADLMMSLGEVERLARHANEATRTMGVGLSPCSLPQTRRANFSLGADEMEVGLGIHGEPGVGREPLRSADAVTDELFERILGDMPVGRGESVAVLVNSLGSTPLMELYIMHRRVAQRLADAGIAIHTSLVGPYCTSLEMAGASISLMRLDDELTRLIDHPADCAMFRTGEGRPPAPATKSRRIERGAAAAEAAVETASGTAGTSVIAMLKAAARAVEADKDRLSALDGAIGDADHGVTMSIGFRAVEGALEGLETPVNARTVFARAAEAFLSAVGASAGPLYANAFLRAGTALRDVETLDGEATAKMVAAMADGVAERGKAEPGEKTMLDAWRPAADAAAKVKGSAAEALQRAAEAALEGAEATRQMRATKGRAARLGDRSIGHVDPGAASAALILQALASAAPQS